MTYRVDCEVLSRDPGLACNSAPLALGSRASSTRKPP
jgi:hypothetical protein